MLVAEEEKVEIWATGSPLGGYSPDGVKAAAKALFPKASEEQIGRFVQGARFRVIAAASKAEATKIIAKLRAAGIDCGAGQYGAPKAAPSNPAAGGPKSSATEQSAMKRQPLRAAKPKSHEGPLHNGLVMVAAVMATLGVFGTVFGEVGRAVWLLPALLVAIPKVAMLIPLRVKVGILASVVAATYLSGAYFDHRATAQAEAEAAAVAERERKIAARREQERQAALAEFKSKRGQIVADAKISLLNGKPAETLAAAAKWRVAGDRELEGLAQEALEAARKAIDEGKYYVLIGFDAGDFPEFVELNQRMASVKKAQAEERCLKRADCMRERAGFAGETTCMIAVEHQAKLVAKYQAKWEEGSEGQSKFLHVSAPRRGVLTYRGGSMYFQNGFGAWSRSYYECDYDFLNDKAIAVRFDG